MAFCQNCGQQVPDGANHCPACGTALVHPQTEQPAAQQNYQQNYQQAAPRTNLDPDTAANKSIAWLSYLGILLLIPLFTRKHSDYCKYHVKQGVIFCAFELCYNVLTTAILGIINLIAPPTVSWLGVVHNSVVYTIFWWIFFVGSLGLLGIAIYGIVNAATGKKQPLFLLSKVKFVEKLINDPFEMAYEVIRKKP